MALESKIQGEFTFTWRIENYSLCYQKPGESILSPMFLVENLDGSKWYLEFFPSGTPENKDFIVFILYKAEDVGGDERIISNLRIDLINDGEILKSQKCKKAICVRNGQFCANLMFEMTTDFLKEKIESYKEDTLIVRYYFMGNKTKRKSATRCEIKTRIGIDRFSFKWNVPIFNFSDWTETRIFLSEKTSLIQITPRTREDSLLITIHKTEENPTASRFVICRVSLLDSEGVERNWKKYTHLFDIGYNVSIWEFPSFITKTQLDSEGRTFLKNGTFTFTCEFSISTEIHSEIFVDNKSEISSPVNKSPPIDTFSYLKEDLRNIFTSKKHSDVKLRVEGDIFPAHKSLLAARSPVFSTMFDQDMLESQTGIVDILDMDAETLNCFLSFVYTGTVDKMDYEIALKLLVAAEKYQVESLKEKCASFLTSDLSDANACEVLAIADMVGHKLLKECVQGYIKARARKILPSREWSQWIEKNVRLASEILSKMSVEFGFSDDEPADTEEE